MAERKILRLLAYDEKLWAIRWQEATWVLSIALLFNLILLRRIADHNVSKLPKMSPLRALKSPQKFRTQGCSSANFLGSRYISDLKTWSLNCLTALTYDDGFFSWLSSYEIKRLERTIIWIPCKNRGENGALFQKDIFLLSSSSSVWHNGTPEFDDEPFKVSF